MYFTWGWIPIRWISYWLICRVYWSTPGNILYICIMFRICVKALTYKLKLYCDYYICPTGSPIRILKITNKSIQPARRTLWYKYFSGSKQQQLDCISATFICLQGIAWGVWQLPSLLSWTVISSNLKWTQPGVSNPNGHWPSWVNLVFWNRKWK